MVSDKFVVLEPNRFNVTPVRVPKVLSNRPKTPVCVISVVCCGLLKLKLTVAALALNASAVPATKAARDFIGCSLIGSTRDGATI